jgi:cytochrome c peroxidase
VTGAPIDRYAFRSPPLRNVGLTAPYGHTGQYRDLLGFLAHYVDAEGALSDYDVTIEVDDLDLHGTFLENRAGVARTMSPAMDTVDLDVADLPSLVRFLEALTDDSARDLCDEVPDAVPSGLSIDDPCLE